ncbi:cupin domain-containing protein [Paraburkholderia sp.]|uniref:cupin domain-containing protein n=1 Tax=Paraburkholderia sp. TaxID=1926495 RepID=UPI00238FDA4A|nr:cupin domain-containing protein [Paraburkholderia sp.]MDE1179799.1 cupin domain-containing protein [Paraburkholderia sp.]
MKSFRSVLVATSAALAVLVATPGAWAHGVEGAREHITPAFQTPIVNVPGKTMTAVVVDYKPGGVSPSHRHGQAFVVGYVLQGAIRSQVDNGESRVYKAGESWTEAPGAHHMVSENASKTQPAKLLAIFVADDGDKDLVMWDKK